MFIQHMAQSLEVKRQSFDLAASESLPPQGPEMYLDSCGCICESLLKFFGGKHKGKERQEERTLTLYSREV